MLAPTVPMQSPLCLAEGPGKLARRGAGKRGGGGGGGEEEEGEPPGVQTRLCPHPLTQAVAPTASGADPRAGSERSVPLLFAMPPQGDPTTDAGTPRPILCGS